MDNTHAASSAQDCDAISARPRAPEPLHTDGAVPREEAHQLVEFAAGLTQQVSELVERARQHEMLAGERRVLTVVHRLVDEREQAAVMEAQARRLIAELQNQLEQARADNHALKSQLDLIRALSGAVPVIPPGAVAFPPPPAGSLSAHAPHGVMRGPVIRYQLDCPWRVDMMERPYVMPLTDRE